MYLFIGDEGQRDALGESHWLDHLGVALSNESLMKINFRKHGITLVIMYTLLNIIPGSCSCSLFYVRLLLCIVISSTIFIADLEHRHKTAKIVLLSIVSLRSPSSRRKISSGPIPSSVPSAPTPSPLSHQCINAHPAYDHRQEECCLVPKASNFLRFKYLCIPIRHRLMLKIQNALLRPQNSEVKPLVPR